MKKIPVRRFDEAQRERGSLERFNIRMVQDIMRGNVDIPLKLSM